MAEEFPIESIMENNGETVIHVGKPHQGYTIITNLVNSKMNGTSRIYSEKKVLIARLQFVDGIANGHCTLYDEYGNLYYKGYFANGLLEGRGTRYDELGKFESEVFYKQGKQLNIIPMEKKKGYSDALYASVIGYFPANNPQLLIYVVIDSATAGGPVWGNTVAGPVFKEVALQSARILNIPPDKEITEQ